MDKVEHDRLVAIREEMLALFEEAKSLMRMHTSPGQYQRIKHTWVSNLDVALGDGDFIDTHTETFKKTLDDLTPSDEVDEEEDLEEG